MQIIGNETVIKPYCLSQFHLKLNVGQKRLIAYKSRDFFLVNNPTKTFKLTITDEHGQDLAEDIAEYLHVSVHILFKRTA